MTNLPQEVKLIAVYARVSTSNQEKAGTIENQLAEMRRYAKENKCKIIQKYLDNGWSGDSIVRPALDQLRLDAKKKVWDAVLMHDPDRLARRLSYQELIADELREAGVEVLFVSTPAPTNEEDKILYGFKGLFAQYERAKIAERFRLGKKQKVEKGHVLTTEAPYGYQYIRNNKETKKHGYYEILPEEARVVRMIFSWIADDGLTLRKVVRRLQELGVKPRKSKRGVWNTSTLTSMLRNKAYIGEAHYGSTYAVVPENPINKEKYRQVKKSSRRMKPEKDWISSVIPVPVIIEKDLFLSVREQLKTNFALCQRNTKNEYLLSKKIRCICGRTRAGEGPQRGKHLYYRCSDRVLSYPLPPTCKERGINARVADKLVWEKVVSLMSSPELLEKQLDRWYKARTSKQPEAIEERDIIENQLKKLKNQEERYHKAYGAEMLTIEQLEKYVLPLKEEMTSLEVKIAKAKQQERQMSAPVRPDKAELQAFAEESVKTLSELSFELKRAIVRNVVEKVIGTQRELQVFGNIPLSLNYVAFNSESRYCRIAQRWEIHTV